MTQQEMERILESAVCGGAEFAELFLEDREETHIGCRDGVLQGMKSLRIYGAGLALIAQGRRVYLHTNRVDEESLIRLAGRGNEMLKAEKKKRRPISCIRQERHNPNAVVMVPSEIAGHKKTEVLIRADGALRGAGVGLSYRNLTYFDTDQRVTVANSEGLLASDRRVTSRIRFQYTIQEGELCRGAWQDYTRPAGFEAFASGEYEDVIREGVQAAKRAMHGKSVKPCTVPVVLAAGGCGTLWHESCGHSLEANAIAGGGSAFAGKLGELVANPKVTLIDDATLPGYYGSNGMDDEGHRTQRNVLIENGVLKGYLCDRYYGSLIGMESCGCGRRQNYTYAPAARMSNTFLAPGTDREEDIIASVEEGLFVKSIGGGTGGAQFTLNVSEGYWIEKGKITVPVSGVMLTGSGIDVIKRVDMVGDRLEGEGGSFCGAGSGLVPTTAFQPMVRISQMSIG